MGLLDGVRKVRTPRLETKRLSVADKQEMLDAEIEKKLAARKIEIKRLTQTKLV